MKSFYFWSLLILLITPVSIGCAHTFITDLPEDHPSNPAATQARALVPSAVLQIQEPRPNAVPPEMMDSSHSGKAQPHENHSSSGGSSQSHISFHYEEGADK